MKFLVIGLGSMGKRRVRCLQSLGYSEIIGYDIRADRRAEAEKAYKIKTVNVLEPQQFTDSTAIVVSTPPDLHAMYAEQAVANGKPVFIEASVLLEEVRRVKKANTSNAFVAPSCTMLFHPMIKDVLHILESGKYGKLINFTYHSGQYLPDWHPWEDMRDYYVSQKETGGAREIVPFELTWMTHAFGMPNSVVGMYGKCTTMPVDIDDVYSCVLRFGNVIGALTVDVTSRFATRSLIVNMEMAQIRWSWEDKCCKIFEPDSCRWIVYNQPEFTANSSYNQNIGEKMYIDEIASFLSGIQNPSLYPNSLEKDIQLLQIVADLEQGNLHKS